MIGAKIFKRESSRLIQKKLTLENDKKYNYKFNVES